MRIWLALLVAVSITVSAALATSRQESNTSKIARALSAGPVPIRAGATVIWIADDGKVTTLRKGTNGWTCGVGTKGEVGADPFCGDAAAMQWANDWMTHKPKPTNTVPGIMYMLAGARDWSATDPYATKGKPIVEPPHWMILYPFGKASALPTGVKMNGTSIMWAGTPYAHLMINQVP